MDPWSVVIGSRFHCTFILFHFRIVHTKKKKNISNERVPHLGAIFLFTKLPPPHRLSIVSVTKAKHQKSSNREYVCVFIELFLRIFACISINTSSWILNFSTSSFFYYCKRYKEKRLKVKTYIHIERLIFNVSSTSHKNMMNLKRFNIYNIWLLH